MKLLYGFPAGYAPSGPKIGGARSNLKKNSDLPRMWGLQGAVKMLYTGVIGLPGGSLWARGPDGSHGRPARDEPQPGDRPAHRRARHRAGPRAADTAHEQKVVATQTQAVDRLGQPECLRADSRIGGEGRPAMPPRRRSGIAAGPAARRTEVSAGREAWRSAGRAADARQRHSGSRR